MGVLTGGITCGRIDGKGGRDMYTDYVVVSVKMPRELKERIDRLSKGKGETRNGWILKRLAREARWGAEKGKK